MPYCTQCATAIADGHRFCPACGAPAVSPAVTAAADDVTVQGSARPAGPSRRTGPASPAGVAGPADPTRPAPASAHLSSGVHGRFEPGTKLGGRYRIVAMLGRGGMGEVYRADDLELGQAVALKFLPQALSQNAAELARFRGEVRVARQIAHQNVCRVYDIGEADGHVFLSMEYVDGEDLASVLRRMGRPSSDKAIEIARQICLGLAAAHEAGMLHRDMKPANIMIDGRGRVRITDFGLAGLADELAKDGAIAGTPAYMAPEQLTGGRASVRSDVYALGLVLYEVFTGKRAFSTSSFAELKKLHESASMTTPSELVRDLDPAVERIILHCLERDPDLRPPSAYAVLGALPGGDPLAAAIAAGETPSPELVANAGDRGTIAPLSAVACIAGGLAAIGIWAGVIGPYFTPLAQPTDVLVVRAGDVLAKTRAFADLPAHTAESFALNGAHLEHLRADTSERARGATPFYFWRRWAPQTIESLNVHAEAPSAGDPPFGTRQATVLLDPAGRLIGLTALPPDTLPAAGAPPPDWSVLFRAAGLDPAAFAPTAPVRAVPAVCDTSAAWKGTLPWAGAEAVTVQAGASRGRLVYFSIVHDWGASTGPLEEGGGQGVATAMDWILFLVGSVVPLVGALYFAVRNLAFGRGDRRGATRIAIFVLVMNILESAFTTRLSEDGLLAVGWDWLSGRGIAHALLHAVTMWFAYVALEPYLRRLWPRLLVSWARLVSGRLRDPLVGRDLLFGALGGVVLTAFGTIVQFSALRWGHGNVPTLVGGDMLVSATSLPLTGFNLSYAGSISVLQTLRWLMIVLVLRLVLRRTWPAVVACALLMTATSAYTTAPTDGWLVAIVTGAFFNAGVFTILMRLGLLPGATAVFVSTVTGWSVATLDFSAWYADRALVPMALVVGLMVFGAATALGGTPIFGDPLRDLQPGGKAQR